MALIEITDNIKRLLDEKNYVIGIFIDFKKAFDTVDHEILLRKLDCYGIRGHANTSSSGHTWQINASLLLLTEYNLILILWNVEYHKCQF